MSRLGIDGLRLGSLAYRPGSLANRSRGKLKFETRTEAAIEDETRVRMLLASTRMSSLAEVVSATALGDRLAKGDERGDWPETLASARFQRDLRERVGGAIWEHVDKTTCRVATCTVIPRGCNLSPEELAVFNAKKLLASFRTALNRCGARGADGWAIVVLHGEFDPGKCRFQIHLHGVVVGGMIDVVDCLGSRRRYASSRAHEQPDDGVYQRVRVSRKPLTNLPSPITYILQPFWPSRWSGDTGDGVINRQRTKHRIPEPYHTQYLLWLDQWSLSEISLLMKLRVQSGSLITK
ncbi:hypothetical protein KZX46_04385 [Polymorphobacter sp. PAMC 29334]|uniref:hypothetical protein n=1 Tax=Polymorphobacter sp. PAMC 29334 TaxID=2862331 RepID=UPI001C764DBE|nr:hypothetical protein [Polymorphobacter sp. PAMC 29334]QYE35245.1 hypothetical protein KZX46_04385 [Polymorphobacter sp. PAMC 29334]